jgi:hypothetical protein
VSAEYELALNAVREATKNFKKVRDSYRAWKIGDAEFLAAKEVYDEAYRVYELAYAKEQSI